jgi:hypothetical protein
MAYYCYGPNIVFMNWSVRVFGLGSFSFSVLCCASTRFVEFWLCCLLTGCLGTSV